MNIFSDFERRIRAIVADLGLAGTDGAPLDLDRIVVEPPRDPAHGDLATNAAMVLAKAARRKPRDLAGDIAGALETAEGVWAVDVAGPGFINWRLEPSVWAGVVRAAIGAGASYGRSDLGAGRRINVEYVSANPTGPLHIGHCRGAVVGDALANLLAAAGWDVTREYYINDAGAQVDVLARSAFLRYREALGEAIGEIPSGLYPGSYLIPVGEALAKRYGDRLRSAPESDWLPPVRDFTIARMLDSIREDLDRVRVRQDLFFSERSLKDDRDRVADAIARLSENGLIYRGVLPPPKGQLPEDWEDREQTLFRATAYGDDVDRPLMKSDGSYTYFASDIAYHFDKLERGFLEMVDIFGADHGGYVKRMQAAVAALSSGKAHLDILLCQLVNLLRAGEPVKMSKRAGDFVTLRDVVDEVGPDAVRFMMLFRKSDAPLDFDFDLLVQQSRENPVFYVQYAHARAVSVMRQAEREMPQLDLTDEALAQAPLARLVDAGEQALIAKVAQWPRALEQAALTREPHRIAFFLHDLAAALHAHWTRGKEAPDLRFIKGDDPELTRARLALVTAVRAVLASGLDVLGVTAPAEMR